jgi:diguanylate cyclase (GGDEF)-like protein
MERALPPAVLYLDFDRFKNINRRFGMGVGDTMLLTMARRLTGYLRPQDALARLGGDKFAILLLADTNPNQVMMLAERLRKALRNPVKIAGEEVIMTTSIGVSVLSKPSASHEELFREAEIAMYRAKRMGTDRIEMFKPDMLSERDDRVALESDLRQAIERQELEVLYQPIMRLSRNELVGFEALLRWEHPRYGTINPAEFVPIAEETGTILELGGFVLDQAVKEATDWHRIVPLNEQPLFVSVNVSSRQLFRSELVSDIRHIMARQNMPRGALRLEITETLVMENPEQAIDILHTLKALGAGLSMDDFGTGYSSLSYLLRFPFDTIKVDREIVQHRGNTENGQVILRSIVALAHELDKNVIAEGIETDEDAAYLRSIRCDYAQGFYFGEPMSSSEVQNLLKALVKAGRLTVKPLSKSSDPGPEQSSPPVAPMPVTQPQQQPFSQPQSQPPNHAGVPGQQATRPAPQRRPAPAPRPPNGDPHKRG